MPNQPLRLWIFHHSLFHYRLPFWDRLAIRGVGRFQLSVFGNTDNGQAIGGGKRDYLHHMPIRGGFHKLGYTFQGGKALIKQQQPEIVMTLTDPRNFLSWQTPKLCATYGGVSILWSKIEGKSSVPMWILNPIKNRLYNQYDFAFVYGKGSAAALEQLGFNPNRIYTSHNTIDTDRIYLERAQILAKAASLKQAHKLENKKILLCIAKFEPQKRHQDLLDAWPRLRELDPCLVLVLAGRGSLSDKIREQVQQLDTQRILHLGSLPEGEDYHWIAAADMTIQCGAVGLAINQSMAIGTATLIADEQGSDSEILQHGVTGWRYEKGNLDALVDAVSQAINDHAQRQRITEQASLYVKEQASIDRMVETADASIQQAIDLWKQRNKSL